MRSSAMAVKPSVLETDGRGNAGKGVLGLSSAICCLALVLLLISAAIILSLISVYLSQKAVARSAATKRSNRIAMSLGTGIPIVVRGRRQAASQTIALTNCIGCVFTNASANQLQQQIQPIITSISTCVNSIFGMNARIGYTNSRAIRSLLAKRQTQEITVDTTFFIQFADYCDTALQSKASLKIYDQLRQNRVPVTCALTNIAVTDSRGNSLGTIPTISCKGVRYISVIGPAIRSTDATTLIIPISTTRTAPNTNTTTTSIIQSWQSRGPNNILPITNINPIGIGAVQATFKAPAPSTTFYLGSVNGGVWKTTSNLAATAAAPQYTPLTDKNLCQSVGTLAGSLQDENFIAYGCNGVSNFNGISGPYMGVYISTNGGTTWTLANLPLGGQGAGLIIRKIIITGTSAGTSTIVVLTSGDKQEFQPTAIASTVAIYTSSDRGATWTRTVGTAAAPIPPSPFDMIQDPVTVTTPAASATLYCVDNQGDVWRNTRGGLGAWALLGTVPLPAATTCSINIRGPNFNNLQNAKLAIYSSGGVVVLYIGYYFRGPPVNNGPPPVCYTFFFSTNMGGAIIGTVWTEMRAPNGGTLYPAGAGIAAGINGQANGAGYADLGVNGATNFAMLADPNNADFLYVGGSATEIFRGSRAAAVQVGQNQPNEGNGGIWTFLRDITATAQVAGVGRFTLTGTGPHTGIRYLDWDFTNSQLICATDGGIWILTNPAPAAVVAPALPVLGDWTQKNGNLAITEFVSVAYDTGSNTIASGAQDNGVWIGAPATSNAITFNKYQTGSGMSVAINSLSTPAILYGTGLNMQSFFTATLPIANPPVFTPITGPGPALGPAFVAANYNPFTILGLNAVNPRLMLICTKVAAVGGNCQTFDFSTVAIGALPVPAPLPPPAIPIPAVPIFTSYKYGGSRPGVPADPTMIFAFDPINRIIYTVAQGVPAATTPFPFTIATGSIQNIIAMNPTNYYESYIVDAQSNVFQTTNFGANWARVTGNLLVVATAQEMPYSWGSVVIPMPTYGVLAVGTATGVYIAFSDKMGPNTQWYKLGLSIPNVVISSFVYDSTRDLLVAATLGRGWWTLSGVSGQLQYLRNAAAG